MENLEFTAEELLGTSIEYTVESNIMQKTLIIKSLCDEINGSKPIVECFNRVQPDKNQCIDIIIDMCTELKKLI